MIMKHCSQYCTIHVYLTFSIFLISMSACRSFPITRQHATDTTTWYARRSRRKGAPIISNDIMSTARAAGPLFFTTGGGDDTTPVTISVKKVRREDIIDVASFRNNCTSPTMMIQRQLEKRDAVDASSTVSDAVTAGLLAGTCFGVGTFVGGDGSVAASLQNFGMVTSVVGGMMLLSGKRVYVYTEAEAVNRLTVDYVAMLKAGVDLGFVACVPPTTGSGRYVGTNGVVGCLDCQVRNSAFSAPSSKTYGSLPPHVLLKNMAVDEALRRQGVGRKLLSFVEEYARKDTDAAFLVLEVDSSNTGAIRLYEDVGFVTEDDIIEKEYRTMVIGRTVMTKRL